jgi:hypothetical protein
MFGCVDSKSALEANMFGHHPLLRHELKKNGRRAFATAVECKRTHILDTEGDPSLVSSTRRLWKLVLRVEPEGEPPFEAKVDEPLPQLCLTAVGNKFPAIYGNCERLPHDGQADTWRVMARSSTAAGA